MFRYFSKTSFSPNGINWGHYADPRVGGRLMQAQQSFDSEQKIELLAQAHAIVLDEAAWTFIVHDLNPRAMSPKVKGRSVGAELVAGLHQSHRRVSAPSQRRRRLRQGVARSYAWPRRPPPIPLFDQKRPSLRPDLPAARRRAQRQSRMPT